MLNISLLSQVDGLITAAVRLYALGGELFSVAVLLAMVNFLAGAIRNTYSAGYSFGHFYRRHLHKPLKWLVVHLVALVILLAGLAWQGAVWVYLHREQIKSAMRSYWKALERGFVYESPAVYPLAN